MNDAPSGGTAAGCFPRREIYSTGEKMGKIKKIIGALIHGPERFDELAQRIAETRQEMEAGNRELHRKIDERDAAWMIRRMEEQGELLNRLNLDLSIHPTIWGDPGRLEIDETASVFTCLFNLNSGRIRIGAYTFAGSGVSLLTGSHDPELEGFLRRDAEMDGGRDVEIGSGVWLASNCTVLGPCRIGNNAVIAAGAVVTPGTEVPEGAIYGGIPAREIGRVQAAGAENPASPAVQRALERCEGTLYVSGWSSRINGAFGKQPGHWLLSEGTILTRLKKAGVRYRIEDAEGAEILLSGPAGECRAALAGKEGRTELALPAAEEGTCILKIRNLTPGARVLLAVEPGEQ